MKQPLPSLRLYFGPSVRERRALAGLHILVLLMLLLAPMVEPARWAGLLIWLLSVWLSWRRKPSEGELILQPDGSWHVSTPAWAGEAMLVGRRLVTPWLIVMRLARSGYPDLALVLWPDSANRDALRQLRVWLRWGGHPRNAIPSGLAALIATMGAGR